MYFLNIPHNSRFNWYMAAPSVHGDWQNNYGNGKCSFMMQMFADSEQLSQDIYSSYVYIYVNVFAGHM